MKLLSTILAAFTPEQKLHYYDQCAAALFPHYALDEALSEMTAHFIQHNAGIVFRLDDAAGNARYLLKIHESAGDSLMDTPAQIETQMAWLAQLANDGEVVVQTPFANRDGNYVTLTQLAGMDRLSPATLQKWITAEHVAQWQPQHAFAVGELLATLHRISSQWQGRDSEQFGAYHEDFLRNDVERLAITLELELIDAEQYQLIRRSGERILAMLAQIERTPESWGLIHGDLHQGNVLFDGGKAVALDFGAFRSYYLYDLGVSLYHASFDEVAIRNALVAGYHSIRPLSQPDRDALEGYMIAAALGNLAFQTTLKEHRLSAINRRNMLQFVEKFCRPFVANEPFLFDGRSLTI